MINSFSQYEIEDLAPIERLSKDLAKASTELGEHEARFLVDSYYQIQQNRITAAAQIRAIQQGDTNEPHKVISWLFEQNYVLEKQLARSLGKFAESKRIGQWLLSITGIGPVIAAGLIAEFDPSKSINSSSFLRFAGLINEPWEKGQKRPYNAKAKTLAAFKLGESFVKVQNNDNDFYGKLFAKRKAKLIEENEALLFKDVALEKAQKVGKSTEAYKSYSIGKLPPAHIHARARRYAVTIFLCHFHETYRRVLDLPVRAPYILENSLHDTYIAPPNLHVIGLEPMDF